MSTSDAFSIPAGENLTCLEFSPFKNSSNLLSYSTLDKLLLLSVEFDVISTAKTSQESKPHKLSLKHFEELSSFDLTGITCISWSPLTKFDHFNKFAKLCVGNLQGEVCVVSTDFNDGKDLGVFIGHKKSINCVSFHPTNENILASVSDDETLKLWNCNSGDIITSQPLSNIGISISWNLANKTCLGKLMVAEQKGKIRFYDVIKHNDENIVLHPIRTLESEGGESLIAADWNKVDKNKVGAVSNREYFVWDLATSYGFPEETKQSHCGGSSNFRWSNFHSEVFMTQGRPKHEMKIHHRGYRELILYKSYGVGRGCSWHSFLPLCVVADNLKLSFHDVSSVVDV